MKARALGIAVEAALAAVATQHGMTVEVLGGIFDNGTYKPRVTFKEIGNDASEFARYASSFGLRESDFGRTFVSNGSTYRITGVKPSAARRPIVARRSDGSVFNFPVAMVTAALG